MTPSKPPQTRHDGDESQKASPARAALEALRANKESRRYLVADMSRGRSGGDQADTLETDRMPTARSLRVSARRRFLRQRQRQSIAEIMPELPAKGEAIHIVGNGRYDYWTFVPHIVGLAGSVETFYASTWTINRPAVVELFELWDSGSFQDVAFLTGLYFKRRETAVYSQLLQGIRRRGGRYRAALNHAKILLFAAPPIYLSLEGSANLTSNPRIEQCVITNDRALFDFHKGWMDECLDHKQTTNRARKRNRPGRSRPVKSPREKKR